MKKDDALKQRKSGQVMYTKGYGSYHISNSYESLLTQILNRDNKINEVILANEPLNLFFDIDLKEQERKQ
ncbi:MAG: hypothetical protein KDD62_11400, partial [Bdellovibrionales bacterium]|nr:hypothetical protein [Bdellovibrionales bacterium]